MNFKGSLITFIITVIITEILPAHMLNKGNKSDVIIPSF